MHGAGYFSGGLETWIELATQILKFERFENFENREFLLDSRK